MLDDYDEYQWTPVIGGSTSEANQTYASQVGRYVKIGRLVAATCYVELTAKGTIAGNVVLKGLPFTIENTSLMHNAFPVIFSNLGVNHVSVLGSIEPNTTYANILGLTGAAAGYVSLTTADISNTTAFRAQIIHRASS